MKSETIQDWIQGFEAYVSKRFNKDYSIIAFDGGKIADIDSICKIVCQMSGITMADLKSNTRKFEIVSARHVAMTLAYKYLCVSLKEVGLFFGKEHTAVIHAKRTVDDKLYIGDATISGLYNKVDSAINTYLNEKNGQ